MILSWRIPTTTARGQNLLLCGLSRPTIEADNRAELITSYIKLQMHPVVLMALQETSTRLSDNTCGQSTTNAGRDRA